MIHGQQNIKPVSKGTNSSCKIAAHFPFTIRPVVHYTQTGLYTVQLNKTQIQHRQEQNLSLDTILNQISSLPTLTTYFHKIYLMWNLGLSSSRNRDPHHGTRLAELTKTSMKKDLQPRYISNRVPSLYKYKDTTVASTHSANCSIFEFRTWRRVNSKLRLSLHHRSSSENPGFATTAFVTTTSLVNCYDLNAQVCTSICLRNNNPKLQVDQIREISAAFTAVLLCSGGLQIYFSTLQRSCQQ
jgi:hypothetical protein